ncbi:MAG: hypothetical protein JRH20_25510 [Deltaproteobacteria bacterium]|nr:hypothetical protein [Deltaproteobacteria bacterium]
MSLAGCQRLAPYAPSQPIADRGAVTLERGAAADRGAVTLDGMSDSSDCGVDTNVTLNVDANVDVQVTLDGSPSDVSEESVSKDMVAVDTSTVDLGPLNSICARTNSWTCTLGGLNDQVCSSTCETGIVRCRKVTLERVLCTCYYNATSLPLYLDVKRLDCSACDAGVLACGAFFGL